ncbi:Uncharacterized membrane protein [Cohaesibacter sp. ES.047]|uniref:DUF1254 domain-containing protein n=1 Tax=Cohaesibacter sp. ES.047 TaxID=1798205 RepID=UPI000BB74EB3|nr:DUF1254 domain-containing protein [Cohaesibacter sp. ES.047]SNY92787.1 Uncharacterized membrane protein [Cohaesibacter sp. ES.047]
MIRFGFVILAALIAAVVIHIATIFSIPYNSVNDVWHKALQLGPVHKVFTISDPKAATNLSRDLDPLFAYGICRADVTSAPIALKGQVPSDFWSLNYVDSLGRSQFSLTNQTSGSRVNIVLASPGQQRLLAERPDLIDDTSIIISSTEDRGLLVLRAFVASEQKRDMIADAISALTCSPLWDPQSFE